MSMRTKYKLGQRVLFTDEDGIEQLATITGITTSIFSDGTKTVYNFNNVFFNEGQIVGLVSVYKPRSRAKKKIEELKNMNRPAALPVSSNGVA